MAGLFEDPKLRGLPGINIQLRQFDFDSEVRADGFISILDFSDDRIDLKRDGTESTCSWITEIASFAERFMTCATHR